MLVKKIGFGLALLLPLVALSCSRAPKPSAPIREDFSLEKRGSEILGEVSGLQAPEAPRATREAESFVMGMWKSIDLCASEEGIDKSDGEPFDRWILLEASGSRYLMEHVLCEGLSPDNSVLAAPVLIDAKGTPSPLIVGATPSKRSTWRTRSPAQAT